MMKCRDAIWKGATLVKRSQGAAPVRVDLPGGARVVWMLNLATEFPRLGAEPFPLTATGPLYCPDLPPASGTRILEEYDLAW
jgi:hypothetical protein